MKEQNPDEKLKSLNQSVDMIDKLSNNFHQAASEDESNQKSMMNNLNDVISGKKDPSELYKTMKTDDDHMDVDEMLHNGHINKNKTQKMKDELSKLMESNKFYMKKISQVDKMTNKLKGIHGDKMGEDTEKSLVKDLISIDKKRDLELDKGMGSLQERDDMRNMKIGSKLKVKHVYHENVQDSDENPQKPQNSR